jgi:hypothetical protein
VPDWLDSPGLMIGARRQMRILFRRWRVDKVTGTGHVLRCLWL